MRDKHNDDSDIDNELEMDDQSDEEQQTTSDEEQQTTSESESTDIDEEDENTTREQHWVELLDESENRHRQKYNNLMEVYIQNGESKPSAEVLAYNQLLPTYRKELRNVLWEKLEWMHRLRKDPYYKKLMSTKQDLLDTGEYDWREATRLAICKRKFLLNDLFTPLKLEINEHEST